MISDKEAAFEREYKQLLERHNVELVVSPWFDEWGGHVNVSFVEKGKYRNINYAPECKKERERNCGMGQ